MALIAEPEQLAGEGWLARVYAWSGLDAPRQFVIYTGMAVIVLLVVSRLVGWAISYWRDRLEWDIYLRTSARLLESYVDRPYRFFLNQHGADLREYTVNETMNLIQGILVPALTLLIHGATALVIILLLLLVNPLVALTAAVVLGGAYGLIYLTRRAPLAGLGDQRLRTRLDRNRLTQELFAGIKTIKAYGITRTFTDRYRRHTQTLAVVNPRLRVIYQMPRFLLEVIAFSGIIGTTLYLYVKEGDLTGALPVLTLFAVAGYRLLPALQQVFGALSTIRTFRSTLDRMEPDLLAALHHEQRQPLPGRPLTFGSDLRLEGVNFTFPSADRPLFTQMDLSIKKGNTVALVGTTGAGKTTAADLLTGLLSPDSGRVLVDGMPLDDTTLPAWREQIAYVPQHVYLLDISLRENICFGLERTVSDEELVQVLKQVELKTFVKALPGGLDTLLGDQGVRLSGGQRQRIGLARALLRRPTLLVLDEATNALDGATEKAVLDTLSRITKQLTVVMIAHRIATVRDADNIVVFEAGRVVGQGNYAELMAGNEYFQRLSASQQS